MGKGSSQLGLARTGPQHAALFQLPASPSSDPQNQTPRGKAHGCQGNWQWEVSSGLAPREGGRGRGRGASQLLPPHPNPSAPPEASWTLCPVSPETASDSWMGKQPSCVEQAAPRAEGPGAVTGTQGAQGRPAPSQPRSSRAGTGLLHRPGVACSCGPEEQGTISRAQGGTWAPGCAPRGGIQAHHPCHHDKGSQCHCPG